MRYFKFVICAAILLFVSGAASAQQDYINNFAGGGPNNVPATSADVNYPVTTATDSAGNFYIVSYNQQRVFKVNSSGTLLVVAGNGFTGYAGDGGPATQAELYLSQDSQVGLDSAGDLYIPDTNNCVVRVVNHTTGNISTFAGDGTCGYGGDGNPATSVGTHLYTPQAVAVDSTGNVYIADYNNYLIRRVNTSGVISTVAGTPSTYCQGSGGGSPCGDGGPATSATLFQVYSIAVDSKGNVFLADSYYWNEVIRVFTPGGNIKVVAGAYGTGPCGQSVSSLCGDTGPATSAGFYYPYGIAADANGNLFIADYYNYDVREVYCADTAATCSAPAGKTARDIYTVAGTGGSYGDAGNGGLATSATLGYASGVAVDSSDDIFIPDYNDLIVREVTHSTGDISTVAGNGTLNFSGNNIPATNAVMNGPEGIAFDASGNGYIADRNNCIVRKVNTSGIITVFAGTPGSCGSGGDGGPATSAKLNQPLDVAVDPSGNVYIADFDNYLIRKVDTSGNITTFAGNGSCYNGDGVATMSGICGPQGVRTDGAGNVYIADTYDELVRKVDTSGNLTTIAGNYAAGAGFSGDGGPATSAQLYYPDGVAVDSAGNVYVSDYYNYRVRKINTLGIISTFAGNGAGGFQGDGGLAVATSLYEPSDVAVDSAGDVLIADSVNQRIRLVDGAGNIHTVAGDGTAGYSGPEENVLATTAELYNPYGVGVDGSGNIYIGDYSNNLVRIVSALAELNGSPSSLIFDTQLTGTTSGPVTLTLTSAGPLTISSITPSAGFSEIDDCPGSLPNGSSCTVDVYFSPTSAGIINGTLTVADNAFFNHPLVITLRGTATDLTITPNPLAFSVVQDGMPATQSVTITGSTTYAATPYTLTGDTTDYSVSSNTCIGLKTSCAIGITFNPGSAGPHTATLWIHDSDPTSAQQVPITGSGCVSGCSMAYETFTPNPVNFGSQTKGVSSAATKVTFTNNNSSGSLTITKPVATTGFKVNITGLTAPICSVTASTTVAAGASCSFNVVFDPTVTGSAVGTVKTTFPNDGHGNVGLTLNVTGEGSATSFTPSPVAIKATMINTTSAKTKVTLKNVGTASITLQSLVSSAPTTFVLSNVGLSPACSLTGTTVIAAAGTCVFDVAFAPGATFGTLSGTITANYTGDPNGDSSHVLNVSGIGTEMKETGALAFSTVVNPATKILSATVTNEGTTTSTITTPSITGTGAAEYSILAYDGTHSTCLNGTVSLTHLQTCTLSVQFDPPVGSGTSYAGDLNINSTGGGPVVVAISGKN